MVLALSIVSAPPSPSNGFDAWLKAAMHPAKPLADRKEGHWFVVLPGYMVMIESINRAQKTAEGEAPTFKKYSVIKIIRFDNRPYPIHPSATSLDQRASIFSFEDVVKHVWAEKLLHHIEKFMIDEYQSRGRGLAADAVRAEKPLKESNAMTIAVTDYNDFSKIHAIGRIVHRGSSPESQLLDLESRTGYRLPEVPIQLDEVGFEEGGWAELKSLVHARKDEDYFVPLIWFSIIAQKKHRYLARVPTTPEATKAQGVVGTNMYALETDRPMSHIFEKLGFKTVQKIPDPKDPENPSRVTYVMAADRVRLETIASQMIFKNMPVEYSVLTNLHDEYPWVPKYIPDPKQLEELRYGWSIDQNVDQAVASIPPELRKMVAAPTPQTIALEHGHVVDCRNLIRRLVSGEGLPFFSKIDAPTPSIGHVIGQSRPSVWTTLP